MWPTDSIEYSSPVLYTASLYFTTTEERDFSYQSKA